MSHSPAAQAAHGTGSGRRTIPTTRSPAETSLPSGAARTRPRFSCPRTRCSRPGGAASYAPETISASVPHRPSASPGTSTGPCSGGGSGTSRSSSESGRPGVTVTARARALLRTRSGAPACGMSARDVRGTPGQQPGSSRVAQGGDSRADQLARSTSRAAAELVSSSSRRTGAEGSRKTSLVPCRSASALARSSSVTARQSANAHRDRFSTKRSGRFPSAEQILRRRSGTVTRSTSPRIVRVTCRRCGPPAAGP